MSVQDYVENKDAEKRSAEAEVEAVQGALSTLLEYVKYSITDADGSNVVHTLRNIEEMAGQTQVALNGIKQRFQEIHTEAWDKRTSLAQEIAATLRKRGFHATMDYRGSDLIGDVAVALQKAKDQGYREGLHAKEVGEDYTDEIAD